MGSPQVLDIESLVSPISEENPSGVELRGSDWAAQFFDLREIFTQSVKAERDIQQAMAFPDEEFPDLHDPQWEDVRDRSIEVLTTYSKDVSVASWLIESVMRLEGIPGLRDGFKMMEQLCETYWDTIHPEPDEDEGFAETVAQLTGLTSERSYSNVENLPLTSGGGGSYSLFDFNESNRIDGLSGDEKQRRISEGAVERAEFDNSFRATPRQHWKDLLEDLEELIATLRSLGTFLDEKCVPNSYGEDTAPSLTSFRQKLEEIQKAIKDLMEELLLDEEEDSDATDAEGEGGEAVASGHKAVVGTIQSRSDAIKMIRKIAEYFRKTEPQSFISFKLEQAAEWAEMPFPDLLKELLRDETALGELNRRSGIPLPPENDD